MKENEKSENQESHESRRHSKPDWMNYALLAGIGILLVVSFTQAIQIGGLQAKILPGATGTASLSAPSGSGVETNAQMMARMHPDQVQPAQASGAPAPANRQIGGC